MKLWKVIGRLSSFFKEGEVVSAAQPTLNQFVLKAENENQMTVEHDRSTKLEDLNVENWALENGFNGFSDFLNSMLGNSRVTEPERNLGASSLCSVSSSRLCSLHEPSVQTYLPLYQKIETLQLLDEISILLAQNDLRREKLLARALAQLQSISTAVHSEGATINIPDNAEVETMTPPTKDIGVDPMFLDTTTMGIADTLPICHTAHYGLLEGNPCSSDTKVKLITTFPSTSSMLWNKSRIEKSICQCRVGS